MVSDSNKTCGQLQVIQNECQVSSWAVPYVPSLSNIFTVGCFLILRKVCGFYDFCEFQIKIVSLKITETPLWHGCISSKIIALLKLFEEVYWYPNP